jgi:hypothetical protein
VHVTNAWHGMLCVLLCEQIWQDDDFFWLHRMMI